MPVIETPRIAVAAIALVLLAGTPAFAQTPPKPADPPGAPGETTPPSESTTPPPVPGDNGTAPDKPLTEELKENQGVLEPPNSLENGIVREAPVPDPGTTPVIPPPESPGGTPDMEPR